MFREQSTRLRTLSISALLVMGVFVIWKSFGSELIRRSQASPLALQGATNRLEVELVTLRASGFEPLEISRPKGPFVLVLDDRSGKEQSSFTLQRVKGDRLREVNTDRRKSEWHDVFNLPPGDYLLTSAASASTCRITILP